MKFKLLDIKKNEFLKVLIFVLMLAIRTCGYTIGWAAINSILLKRLGLDSLPYSFIFFSLIGIAGAVIYLFFADAVSRETLIKVFSISTGALLIIAGIFIPSASETGDITPGLILAACLILLGDGIGYSITGIQIWTLVNDAFTPDEGTRVYPLIALSPSLGSIFAGLLIPILIKFAGTKSLIIIWGISVLAVLPLLSILEKYYGKEIASRVTYLNLSPVQKSNFIENFKEGCKFSLHSPMVHMLAAICILFWTVASLKEFQYGRILSLSFPTEEALSIYYGYYTIILRIAVLFFQLFLTSRIIKSIGVNRGFCVLPVSIFLCLVLILFSFSLVFGVIMRFIWDLFAMTIQLTVFHLSFNAIYGPYRGRIRGILEGLINPVGGILGGVTLIIINKVYYNLPEGLADERVIITIFAILFSLLWIFISFIAKKRYNNAILENLESEDRRTFLDSIEMLVELDRKLAVEKLCELSKSDDPEVKKAIIKVLPLLGYKEEDLFTTPEY